MSAHTALTADGLVVVYRLHDVGYAIDLERAAGALAERSPNRARPERGEAEALEIANPPVQVELARTPLRLDGMLRPACLTARLYEFGVCALRLEVETGPGLDWEALGVLGRSAEGSADVARLLDGELARLVERLGPAVERPAIAPVEERYVVFRVHALRDAAGAPVAAMALDDARLVSLLLGEHEPLSAAARRELLTHRFSYYARDFAVLTWDNALVVDERREDRDVELMLELANAQLLELRVYDALLDAELPRTYDQMAGERQRRRPRLTRSYRPLLAAVQTVVADVTETVERSENALKVTEDVYLSRVYAAALSLFREADWRRGIDRKLRLLRDAYGMLNDEAQHARAELLEITIVLLILFEIIWGFVRPH